MSDVGKLRQQTALCDSGTPIVVVSNDPEVTAFLRTLRVERVYPDTTDANGQWASTFKIKVVRT